MNQKFIIATITIVSASLFIGFLYPHVYGSRAGDQVLPAKVPAKPDSVQSRIQIVFALDATGSMSGLIGAAKEKIWSIAGSLAQADPAPVIEIGLIFYRDRGDAFVTRQVALSSDIDDVYEKLMQISADGGGDSPESVNQALHEAITKFKWDSSFNTYKTVFLVGDCPPHMDYRNDVKYPVSCSLAKQKDIVLNTILMGNNQSAMRVWKEIAVCNQGSYTQVDMNANDIVVNTPYDSVIADLSDKLDDTRIYYGNEEEKSLSFVKVSKSKSISNAVNVNIKAQRAEYNSTKAGKDAYYGKKELLESYKGKSVSLDTIKKEELPDAMKNMTAAQKEKFMEQKIAQRDSLNIELKKYTKQRQEFIEKDLKNRKAGEVDSSFSNKIYKSIQKQTEKKKIYLKADAKY
jgi:Mg-chelatase subunit ChlD